MENGRNLMIRWMIGGVIIVIMILYTYYVVFSASYTKIVHNIYVIPGGGSGSNISGYPEWTSRRTMQSYQNYVRQPISAQENTVFLALSAGSLNTPNRRRPDDRIIFECEKTIEHLVHLGVPKHKIFGDFLSWDTVTNGLTLRLFLEGYLTTHPEVDHVNIEVFISDFHKARVKLSFEWILNLSPSLLSDEMREISLNIHEVTSLGIFDSLTLQERIQHEQYGIEKIKDNQRKIHNIQSLYAFLFVGGHRGIWDYLHGDYTGGGTTVGYR